MPFRRSGHLILRKFAPISLLLLLAGQILLVCSPVLAQSGPGPSITAPDTSKFPIVSFYMEAYDSSGIFLSDLKAADVQALENGGARPVSAINLIQPGLQITVAMNIGPTLANRTSKDSFYKLIQASLQTWAKAQPAGTADDFTLIGNDGVQVIHQNDPQRWDKALGDYQPDLLHGKPSLSSLSQALDIATDPNPTAIMKRALLYITPLPADNTLSALPNLAERAVQEGVHISIWLVAPAGSDVVKGGAALHDLATHTGGQFFLFTGVETLPNPEMYFQPFRSLYQVTYTSAIVASGEQRLAVKINHTGVPPTSNEQTFKLTVQPPNPMFLDPPAQVRRVLDAQGKDTGDTTIPLRIMIEFPDGHPRALKSTALWVDGKLVAEQTSQPFDQFSWPLTGYTANQRHMLQVKVQDVLGLGLASIQTPVDVVVDQPNPSWIKQQISPRRLKIGGAILLAGVALGMVLWITGRRGWFSAAERRRRARMLKDPVTQPVNIRQEEPRKPTPAASEHPSWPRPAPDRKAPALLVRLNEDNQPVPGHTVPVHRREITFGSNPQQASCVINAPSVEGLHARLQVSGDNQYTLSDAGSVAGTWVNFSPVSAAGTRLQHGDIIHLGQVAFRFELAKPGPARQARVSKYEDQP